MPARASQGGVPTTRRTLRLRPEPGPNLWIMHPKAPLVLSRDAACREGKVDVVPALSSPRPLAPGGPSHMLAMAPTSFHPTNGWSLTRRAIQHRNRLGSFTGLEIDSRRCRYASRGKLLSLTQRRPRAPHPLLDDLSPRKDPASQETLSRSPLSRISLRRCSRRASKTAFTGSIQE